MSALRKARPFAPAALYYGLIFCLSSRPLQFGVDVPGMDKLAHVAAFALLGFLLALGLFSVSNSTARRTALRVVLTGAVLGILDEVHQIFVPGRTADPFDAAADAAGIGLGLLIYWAVIGRKKTGKNLRASPAGRDASG